MKCSSVNEYCDNSNSFDEICIGCNRCLRFDDVCRYCKWFNVFMSVENGICKLNPIEVSKRHSDRCSHFKRKGD